MVYAQEIKEGKLILYLDGEIDLDKTDFARNSMLKCIEKNNKVFVNLAKVSYIDSSGISVLIEAHQKAQELEKEFYLQNPSNAVMSVLEMAKLDVFFNISK
jgi:anti-anti-sigma factor